MRAAAAGMSAREPDATDEPADFRPHADRGCRPLAAPSTVSRPTRAPTSTPRRCAAFPHLAGRRDRRPGGRRTARPARPGPAVSGCRRAGIRSRPGLGARRRLHRRVPRHARVELGRARARRARHPGLRGRLHEVPRRRALSRCRPTTCCAAWQHAREHAEELLGVDAGGAPARRRERGWQRSPPVRSRGCGMPASRRARRAGDRLSRRAPERRASGRDRPGVAARAARAQLRRLGRGARATRTRSPGSARATDSRRRSSSCARSTDCDRRARRSRAQLADAGVDVTLHLEPGADHGHINEPSDPTALPTIEAIAAWIGTRGGQSDHDHLHQPDPRRATGPTRRSSRSATSTG